MATSIVGVGIDNSRIIEAFRNAARSRGIDPVAGSSVYEAVNVRAEIEGKRKASMAGWWSDALWDDEDAESDGTWDARRAAPAPKRESIAPIVIPRDAAIMAYLIEGMRGAITQMKAELPLSQLHQVQQSLHGKRERDRVKWIPVAGVPTRVSVGVLT